MSEPSHASTAEPFLHLTSGASAGGGVRMALVRLGRKEEVVAFHDAPNQGPLQDIDQGAASRAAWWSRVYEHAREDYEPPPVDDGDVWKSLLDDPRPVVLWHGPHPNDLLYALRACWKLRHQPARVHEVALGAPPRGDNGRAPPDFCGAVGMQNPEKLANAWQARAPVVDVEDRAQRWEDLRARTGDWFRELVGNEFTHLPVDGYDARIVEACGGNWTGSINTIARVIATAPIGDAALAWRVREMLASGALVGRGEPNWMNLPEEVRPLAAPT